MITAEHLKTVPLLANVPERELTVIASRAADVYLRTNDWLIQEGEVPAFFILLSGKLTVSKYVGGIERVINTYRPGDHAGEVPLLLGSPAIASLRAAEATRVCRLEPEDFRDLIAACAQLNAELMRTMATRIGHLQQVTAETPIATVRLIGHRFDLACHALRDFLARNRVSFRWHDIHDPEARIGLAPTPQPTEAYPVVVLPDGERLTTPTFRTVAERLGLQTDPSNGRYDVAIVGAGPAGLAAAVYGASEGMRTLLLDGHGPGGQAAASSRIENYLGFPSGVSGSELTRRALAQAQRFGAEFLVPVSVTGLSVDRGYKRLRLDEGREIVTRAVIAATGMSYREHEASGIADFTGAGVYYGAAVTEAHSCRECRVVIIGGGNSAGQSAVYLSRFAAEVDVVVRRSGLAETMSRYLTDQLAALPNVRIRPRTIVERVGGERPRPTRLATVSRRQLRHHRDGRRCVRFYRHAPA